MQKRIDDLRGTFPPEGAFVLGGSLKAPKELPPLQSTGSVTRFRRGLWIA